MKANLSSFPSLTQPLKGLDLDLVLEAPCRSRVLIIDSTDIVFIPLFFILF